MLRTTVQRQVIKPLSSHTVLAYRQYSYIRMYILKNIIAQSRETQKPN